MLFKLFKRRERLIYQDFELRLRKDQAPNSFNDHARTYIYDMVVDGNKVGRCELRCGMNDSLYYLGQIGYTVFPEFRGHHYAYKSCLLLFKKAFEQCGMQELLITCNPDNFPSFKTLSRLNGRLDCIVDVPENHYLYFQGDRQKCIFIYNLKDYDYIDLW